MNWITAAAIISWPSTGPLTTQQESGSLSKAFSAAAQTLIQQEAAIVDELNSVQGKPVDLGGYYKPDPARCTEAMCPSSAFNAVLASLHELVLA